MNFRRFRELSAAVAFAVAAVLWVGAVHASILGKDASGDVLLVDLLASFACIVGATVAGARLAIVGALAAAVVAVAFFGFDVVLNMAMYIGFHDSPPTTNALTFYASTPDQPGFAWIPALGSLAICGLALALRRRAPIAWVTACIVAIVSVALAWIGRDSAALAALWYLARAIDLGRPPSIPSVAS